MDTFAFSDTIIYEYKWLQLILSHEQDNTMTDSLQYTKIGIHVSKSFRVVLPQDFGPRVGIRAHNTKGKYVMIYGPSRNITAGSFRVCSYWCTGEHLRVMMMMSNKTRAKVPTGKSRTYYLMAHKSSKAGFRHPFNVDAWSRYNTRNRESLTKIWRLSVNSKYNFSSLKGYSP